MTTAAEYVRDRTFASGRIPEGQLALYDIVAELSRRIDALESDVSVLRDAQSDSGGFVRVAHMGYTDALRWLGIAASEGLDHSTRISLIEDAIGALHKCSKDEGELVNALFAALTMLEKMEARIAALETERPVSASKVLYEGEARVLEGKS